MNKVMLGLVLGAVLGLLDGLSAWFTPAVRSMMATIVLGSTVKGLVAGLLIGWFARKVRSVPLGVLFGLVVGFILAYIIAAMPDANGNHYWFEIILPGTLVGLIVGYATQRYGKAPVPKTA
jgi:F0F1-type ATP synthase assembly protein I